MFRWTHLWQDTLKFRTVDPDGFFADWMGRYVGSSELQERSVCSAIAGDRCKMSTGSKNWLLMVKAP